VVYYGAAMQCNEYGNASGVVRRRTVLRSAVRYCAAPQRNATHRIQCESTLSQCIHGFLDPSMLELNAVLYVWIGVYSSKLITPPASIATICCPLVCLSVCSSVCLSHLFHQHPSIRGQRKRTFPPLSRRDDSLQLFPGILTASTTVCPSLCHTVVCVNTPKDATSLYLPMFQTESPS